MVEFKVHDKVQCSFLGRETTSTSLKVGDVGEIIAISDGPPVEYLVDFVTEQGYRRQWVYAHSIKLMLEVETDLYSIIKDLDKLTDRLKDYAEREWRTTLP